MDEELINYVDFVSKNFVIMFIKPETQNRYYIYAKHNYRTVYSKLIGEKWYKNIINKLSRYFYLFIEGECLLIIPLTEFEEVKRIIEEGRIRRRREKWKMNR